MERKYDIIVWGATGFTGKLVVEYISKTYPGVRWALAGRNKDKLQAIITKLSLSLNVIIASIDNDESMDAMCKQTKVLLSTAGPFALLGTPVVAACVRSGTNYCDITGEGQWYREIVDKYHNAAQSKKIKIIPSCGLDCVPSDFGALMIVNQLQSENVTNVREVRMVIDDCKVNPSGGTLASVMNIFDSCSLSEMIALTNPYYLNPKDANQRIVRPPCDAMVHSQAGDSNFVGYDSLFVSGCKFLFNKSKGGFVAPWMMQMVNTRIVNRSNALCEWKYGRNFVYSERLRLSLFAGLVYTVIIQPIAFIALLFTPLRWFIHRLMPQSGDGADREAMKTMGFHAVLWGTGTREVTSGAGAGEVTVYGQIDIHGCPGYLKTAVMLSECAVALALDSDVLPSHNHSYGIVTPAIGIGKRLLDRFHEKDTGIKFSCSTFKK